MWHETPVYIVISHILPSVWQWSSHNLFWLFRSVTAGIRSPYLIHARLMCSLTAPSPWSLNRGTLYVPYRVKCLFKDFQNDWTNNYQMIRRFSGRWQYQKTTLQYRLRCVWAVTWKALCLIILSSICTRHGSCYHYTGDLFRRITKFNKPIFIFTQKNVPLAVDICMFVSNRALHIDVRGKALLYGWPHKQRRW